MRAVVKVQQSQGRAPSNAARYIAESKLDPEREGNKARPLFTNRGDDDLKYGDANRYLNDGPGRPAKGDLIHFSVSFREEDFKKLGATDEERKEGLREAAREAMDDLRADLRIRDWRWAAAIHLNTPYPHIHFLISKEITDERGKARRLGKIPKGLLPRMGRSPGGTDRPVQGKLGEHFVAALDRAQERVREADRKRDEDVVRTTTERLEEGPGAKREDGSSLSQVQVEPSLRDHTVGRTYAIKVVNKNHFKPTGADNEVYIGRAMPGINGSVLANQFRIGRDGTREEVIEKNRLELQWKIVERGEEYRELQRLAEIARRGDLVLVCWCAPEKCHGDLVKSEIEAINHLQNQGLEVPDMDEILDHSLEFDKPLVHQGIEYRTVENFYQAMKITEDDLAMRRKIAAATPDEARRLGAEAKMRPDWQGVWREVIETALQHKFAPGTSWHTRLVAKGDQVISDGSRENILGNILMRLRDTKEKPDPVIRFYSSLRNDYRSFSNFSPHSIVMDGLEWPTVEHYYQAQKFTDQQYKEQIRQAESPTRAKAMGRNKSHPIRPDWEQAKEEIMSTAILQKFRTHADLRELLLSTGKGELIEASPYDSYWGRGRDGTGQNRMGQLLMGVREELREQVRKATRVAGAPQPGASVEPALAHSKKPLTDKEKTALRIETLSKAEADRRANPPWIDRMMEVASHNPSLAGRELTMDILGRELMEQWSIEESRFKEELRPTDDIRYALASRSLDDSDYHTQVEQAGELGKYSSELRALYESGAEIKDDTLIIPAEELEVPGERDGIRVVDISHAHRKFDDDPRLAAEFHWLGRAIAGENADLESEIKIFQHYFNQLEKDEDGRPLDQHAEGYNEKRAQALERTLAEMRFVAGEMAREETRYSAGVASPIIEPSYAYHRLGDRHLADEFSTLALRIAGEDADVRRLSEVLEYYYSRLDRDEDGHRLRAEDEAGRTIAIERTLAEMREAPERNIYPEIAGPPAPEDIEREHAVVSYGEVEERENADPDDPEEPIQFEQDDYNYEGDEWSNDLDLEDYEHDFARAYSEGEADRLAWRYNTAARKVNLRGDRLRLPVELNQEQKQWIVEVKLPEIDRRLESGHPLRDVKDKDGNVVERGIISDLNSLIYPERDEVLRRVAKVAGFVGDEAKIRTAAPGERDEAKRVLAALKGQARIETDPTPDGRLFVGLSGGKDALRVPVNNIRVYDVIDKMPRNTGLPLYTWKGKNGPPLINGFAEREYDALSKAVAFLKSYTYERLRDPETRLTHGNETFRNARRALDQARTYEELNRVAYDFMSRDERDAKLLSERERERLFYGRTPEHYTLEIVALRQTWGLPREGREQALRDDRLPMSETLSKMVADLKSRPDVESVRHFQRALLNPPERMDNPARLPLYEMRKQLPGHEKDFVYHLAEELKQQLPRKERPVPGTSKAQDEPATGRAFGALPRESQSYKEYITSLGAIRGQLLTGAAVSRLDGKGLPSIEEAQKLLLPEQRKEIHNRACNLAWQQLAIEEMFHSEPAEPVLRMSEKIRELQEEVQPRARLADQVLDEFSKQNIPSYKNGQVPKGALEKLDPAIKEKYEQLKDYATREAEELYRGFEAIDELRREIELARAGKLDSTKQVVDEPHKSQTLVETTVGSRESYAGAQETVNKQKPVTAGRPTGEPPRESPSYREYIAAVAEIEKQLIDEEIKHKQPDEEGRETTQAEGLLNREEKLRIRTIAAGLAWERIEPRETQANDPAEKQFLSLREAIKQLRDKAQPRAREATVELDEFIRSHNLDQFAKQTTDFYYRADQIPKAEIQKLSLDDKREFTSLERRAAATLREFKEGFAAIDSLRLEIENVRNGNGDSHTYNGKGHTAGRDNANGGGNHSLPQNSDREALQDPPGKDPTPDRERMNDRIILGAAIIAHARVDAAVLDYERACDHGHTFRFNIHDESIDGERRISKLDVNRRADARGNRAADERGAERYDDRSAIRREVSEADRNYHSTTLEQHDQRLDWLVKQLADKANVARGSYQHARQLVQEVVEKYQNRGEPLPSPFVERKTLVKAQNEAIEHGFAGHTEKLERLREALAEEHGQPTRTDQEASRLAAQLFTARTEMKAQEERANKFDETRHLRQWETGGEKFSLVDLDRRLERAADAAQIVGKYEIHFSSGDRRQAEAESERLSGIRAEITRTIGEHQTGMRQSVAEAGKLFDTLTRAYERENALREQAGLAMPAPQFKRRELNRAADNIESTRDAVALRELSAYERQFNTYADQKERFISEEEWGRAPGRAFMAAIFQRASKERVDALELRGEIQPLLVETSDGRIHTQRLQDTQPRTITEMIVRPIIETPSQREIREGTQAAFTQYQAALKADFEKTQFYQVTAQNIAAEQAAERNQLAGRELPAAKVWLTPKQDMEVVIRAERETNTEVRDLLLSVARGSAQTHSDSFSQARSPERDAAREAAPSPGRGR